MEPGLSRAARRRPEAIPPSALPRPFRATWSLRGPNTQTLVARYLRPTKGVSLTRERWITGDQDFLDLDFGPSPEAGAPVVLVLHGLEGSSRRGYCMQVYRALLRNGIMPVGMNFRGCSGEPNLRARAYHSGETGDLAEVLERLAERFPGRPIGAVGFSLGGNVLLKGLGEWAEDSRVDAAVAISVPYDLSAGSTHLERGFFRKIYTRYFLKALVAKVRSKEHVLHDRVDLERAARSKTLREFDDLVTAPLHGFSDAEEYYRECSSAYYLEGIRIPTLLLHSMDDPFLPRDSVPVDRMMANTYLRPTLTSEGGHVGFLAGSLRRPRFWAEESAARFLAEALKRA